MGRNWLKDYLATGGGPLLSARSIGSMRKRMGAVQRERDLAEQLEAFELKQRVRVVRDHDGDAGRWVGVIGHIVNFDRGWPYQFPWVIEAESGARMYAAADMLEPA